MDQSISGSQGLQTVTPRSFDVQQAQEQGTFNPGERLTESQHSLETPPKNYLRDQTLTFLKSLFHF